MARCQVSPEEEIPRVGAPATVENDAPSGVPPTAPLALRAWLEQRQYRETWDLWPGTEPLHSGAEPHGALHTTWVSPLAMDGLERGLPVMPHGAIVLLGEHGPDSLPGAVNVMIQVGGTEAHSQDWLFARLGSTGEIEPTGMCENCHVSDPDWLFSGELGSPLPVDSTGVTSTAPGSS